MKKNSFTILTLNWY